MQKDMASLTVHVLVPRLVLYLYLLERTFSATLRLSMMLIDCGINMIVKLELKLAVRRVINPRHACTARIRWVCVCVCLLLYISLLGCLFVSP